MDDFEPVYQPWTWEGEFGPEYQVPDAIALHDDLQDTSWHNNGCPSFEVFRADGQGLLLWVEHVEPAQRGGYDPDSDLSQFSRFSVSALENRDRDLGVTLLETENLDEVLAFISAFQQG